MPEITEKTCANRARMGRIGYRPYWVFTLSILIRALHQVGAAVFLTAFLVDALPEPPAAYVGIVMLTGILLLASEGLRHRQVYRELSGMTTLVKLLCLGAAFHGILPAQWMVPLAFIIASIGSHAPKEVRHRLLF